MEYLPHVNILELIKEAPFGMGRALLAECITGDKTTRVKKLRLDKMLYFGSLPLFSKKDVYDLLNSMISKGLIEYRPLQNKRHIRVLHVTAKGEKEIKDPSKMNTGSQYEIEKVTDEDRKIFSNLKMLDGLSDEQKKAVASKREKILCIAGAGSGKTRVLTKRAWFLAAYRSVPEENILAITFTRKARYEMMKRLDAMLPGNRIRVETFNSFCESILKENEEEIYGKKFRVMSYSGKIKLFRKAVSDMDVDIDKVLNAYYTDRQYHSADNHTLLLGYMNDLYNVMDYQRNNDMSDNELYALIDGYSDRLVCNASKDIIRKMKAYKKELGVRDYTDQIVHASEFLKDNRMGFSHVLVDEYQDINHLQYKLLRLLDPQNLFAVGDPRQCIYGWRGSMIDYILDFEENYPGAQVLQLSKNYRSDQEIVKLCNKVIKKMKLPDLIAHRKNEGKSVRVIGHNDEEAEMLFIAQSIMQLDVPRDEVMVLARTNRQIEKLAEIFVKFGIKHLTRTIEDKKRRAPAPDEVTLSTIHAIKGLEADTVYVLGASSRNHPIRSNDHALIEAVKINDTYDSFEEELRLFYVALSRAKNTLVINYSGTPTSFLDVPQNTNGALYAKLRQWRYEKSRMLNIPPYQIFNDRSLDEICSAQPLSNDELQDIYGFGSYKARRWGKEIIEIVEKSVMGPH